MAPHRTLIPLVALLVVASPAAADALQDNTLVMESFARHSWTSTTTLTFDDAFGIRDAADANGDGTVSAAEEQNYLEAVEDENEGEDGVKQSLLLDGKPAATVRLTVVEADNLEGPAQATTTLVFRLSGEVTYDGIDESKDSHTMTVKFDPESDGNLDRITIRYTIPSGHEITNVVGIKAPAYEDGQRTVAGEAERRDIVVTFEEASEGKSPGPTAALTLVALALAFGARRLTRSPPRQGP